MEKSTKRLSLSAIKEADILSLNKLALEHLKTEEYESSLNYLEQSLLNLKTFKPSQSIDKLSAITYKNLGFFYKKVGKLQEGINWFLKALEIEKKIPNQFLNVAGTYLNICSIFSQLKIHEKALQSALKAIEILQNNYSAEVNIVTTLVIALHNAGVEHEHLFQFGDALECYESGLKLSKEHLGTKNNLTLALKRSLDEVSGQAIPLKNSSKWNKGTFLNTSLNYSLLKDTKKWSLTPKAEKSSLLRNFSQDKSNKRYVIERKSKESQGKILKKVNTDIRNRTFSARCPKNSIKPDVYWNKNRLLNSTIDSKKSVSAKSSISSYSPSLKMAKLRTYILETPKVSIFDFPEEKPREKLKQHEVRSNKIDLINYKEQERTAVIMIQAWWRGVLTRLKFKEKLLMHKLKNAAALEAKAQFELSQIKIKMNDLKRNYDMREKNTHNDIETEKKILEPDYSKKIVKIAPQEVKFKSIEKKKIFESDISKDIEKEKPRERVSKEIEKKIIESDCEATEKKLLHQLKNNRVDEKKKPEGKCIVEAEKKIEDDSHGRKNEIMFQNILKIQSSFRSFLCKQKCKKMIISIKKIQASVRMFLIRRLYRKILSAIIFIQLFVRAKNQKINKTYKRLNN
ncbi:unnamed protein product [Blepharisma stoltei]|uniref:Uncharacterized protein n=1 Tax=Blepharisma stoltei TaxID=1481888 RepID=A0AAU9IYW2_9CILI|nr:unnamed protein product [Blepharisma stoltei]